MDWAEVAHSVFSKCVSRCFAHVTGRPYWVYLLRIKICGYTHQTSHWTLPEAASLCTSSNINHEEGFTKKVCTWFHLPPLPTLARYVFLTRFNRKVSINKIARGIQHVWQAHYKTKHQLVVLHKRQSYGFDSRTTRNMQSINKRPCRFEYMLLFLWGTM